MGMFSVCVLTLTDTRGSERGVPLYITHTHFTEKNKVTNSDTLENIVNLIYFLKEKVMDLNVFSHHVG